MNTHIWLSYSFITLPLIHNFMYLRSRHIMCSLVSHILGWNLSFCHEDCIPLIAWHDESLHSLLLSAWSRMRLFAIPAPGDPSGNTYVGPADCLILAVAVRTHGQNCCAGWDERVSMSSNCLGPHVLSTGVECTVLGLILVKSPLFPFLLEWGNFCFAASHKYRKLTGASS